MPSPVISSREVETRARILRDANRDATPYHSLTLRQQSWAWDHMRTRLQAAAIEVGTRADWYCSVTPPDHPPQSPDDLLAILETAKHCLVAVPPIVATAVLAAECFVADTIDRQHEAAGWRLINGEDS